MLISLFSSFIISKPLGNDAVPLYEVSLRLAFHFFGQIAKLVNLKLNSTNCQAAIIFIGALVTKLQKFSFGKSFMFIKQYFKGI